MSTPNISKEITDADRDAMMREAMGKLPSGMNLLRIDWDLKYLGPPSRERNQELHDIYLFLSTLGNVRESYDEKKVTKGIQLNLLVSDTVMRQWCVNDRGVLILYKIGLANARKHFELINGRYTRSDSLATMRPENDPYWDIRGVLLEV